MKNPYGDEIEFSAKANDSQIQLATVDDGTLRVTLEGEYQECLCTNYTLDYNLTIEQEDEMFRTMLKRRIERGSAVLEDKVEILKAIADSLDILIVGNSGLSAPISSDDVSLAVSSDGYNIIAGQTVLIQVNLTT